MTSADNAPFFQCRASGLASPGEGFEPVFSAPWQATVFAMTLALYERGCFTWAEWAEYLSHAIREAQAAGDPDHGDTYYDHWLAALERLATNKAWVTGELLRQRRQAWDEAARKTPHGKPIELP